MRRLTTVRTVRQLFEEHVIFVEPELVWMLFGESILEFVVGDDASLLGINQEHTAGLQAAFLLHAIGFDRQHTRF